MNQILNHKRIIIILVVLGILAGIVVVLWPTLRKSSSDEQEPFLESDSETLSDWEGYAHPELPFAFAYPKDLTPSTFVDGEAEIILLKGKEPEREVQIVIRAFDEPFDPAQGKPGPLTVERIRRDVPEMVIEEPQNVLIGSAQIPALLFWSESGSAGRTREVWFVQGGYLYQITGSAEMDETFAKMMETWRGE